MDEPARVPEHGPRPSLSPSFTSLVALFAGPALSVVVASQAISFLYPMPDPGPNGMSEEQLEAAFAKIIASRGGPSAFILPGQLTLLALALLIAFFSQAPTGDLKPGGATLAVAV